MYRFLIALIIFFLPLNVLAQTRTIVTRRPVYNHYRPYYNRPNTFGYNYRNPRHYTPRRRLYNPRRVYNSNFSDLNALEKYTLSRTYGRESDIERLQRLEMQAFGAIQNGDINTRYDNVRSAILSRPKQNYKTSWLRNIGNYFSGQMTGFTPGDFTNDPFFSSPGFSTAPYPSTYGNSNITQFSGPFGSGYRYNNYGTGSSTGVKILD